MKSKIINSRPLTAVLLLVLFGLIGVTIAYYQSSDTYTNEFTAGEYIIRTEETFESPTNWKPGDTTPKEVSVKNEGNVPAAVKVCFTPKWEDENGDELPLFDSNYEFAALIDFDQNYDLYWKSDCDNNFEDLYCFYYYKALDPGETTKPLLKSITFNPYFEIELETVCTTNDVTHKTTCITDFGDYSGGKYKLEAKIETVQYRHYQDIWPTAQEMNTLGSCEAVKISETDVYHNLLMINSNGNETNVFGSDIPASNIESLEIKDDMNIPATAINSWDVSYLGNGTVMAWVVDTDNNGKYEMYIGADGKVTANPDSSNAFKDLSLVTKLDVTNLDTSHVVNMHSMFEDLGRTAVASTFVYSGFANFDTSNVTDIGYMFANSSGTGLTIDFSNWDVSKIQNNCNTFYQVGFTVVGTDEWPSICP